MTGLSNIVGRFVRTSGSMPAAVTCLRAISRNAKVRASRSQEVRRRP